jgi:hypothetical protein
MACPYFYPVDRNGGDRSASFAILPLGDAWSGVCRAAEGSPHQPEDTQLRPLCYFGYARGRCHCFPALDAGPDAIRFTIASDDGAALGVSYVMERDHHPYAHGRLQYSRGDSGFLPQPAGEIFARQAQAYVESYLRRKNEALAR